MNAHVIARRNYAADRIEALGRKIFNTEIAQNIDGLKRYLPEDRKLMQHIRRVGLKVLAEAKSMRSGNHRPHRAKGKSHPPATITP